MNARLRKDTRGILAAGFLAGALLCSAPKVEGAESWVKRVLFNADSAARWSAPESTMIADDSPPPESRKALHWQIKVDHFAGEAKYPIGWPRVNQSLRDPGLRDWSGWDYLRVRVFTETSGKTLPRIPAVLILHTPDKQSAFNRELSDLKKGKWVEILIPLSAIPRHHDVRFLQFAISDSNYAHGDRLDFYFDEIALLRHSSPVLREFAAESAVVFSDLRTLPVRFELLGVKPGEEMKLVLELKNGRETAVRAVIVATRGPQRVRLDLSQAALLPGDYELVASGETGQLLARPPLRLVKSPWESKP